MEAEEAAADAVSVEYFLTPESSSSAYFSSASSTIGSSAAAKKAGNHGYVSPSAVERRE